MRLLKYAVKNSIRNSFLTVSSILTIALIVFFINLLFLLGQVTVSLVESVNDRVSISLSLKTGYTDTNVQVVQLEQDLKKVPGIVVSYISSDQAFDILRRRNPDLARVVDNSSDNPLPASLSVTNIPLASYQTLNSVVEHYKSIILYNDSTNSSSIADYINQYKRISNFVQVLTAIEYGIYALIAFFILAVFIIIYTVIGNFIFFYREEIHISQLVWWENIFIYGPFAIQGALYTFAAWVFSGGCFLLFLNFLDIGAVFGITSFMQKITVYTTPYLFLEWSMLLVVGFLSGLISAKRFIKETAKNG